LLKQKGAIILGYFIPSKNHEPPKVAQLAKKSLNLVTLLKNSQFDELGCLQAHKIVEKV
jgi:hypothetical protein